MDDAVVDVRTDDCAVGRCLALAAVRLYRIDWTDVVKKCEIYRQVSDCLKRVCTYLLTILSDSPELQSASIFNPSSITQTKPNNGTQPPPGKSNLPHLQEEHSVRRHPLLYQ